MCVYPPEEIEQTLSIRRQHTVVFRPIRSSDASLLLELFHSHSAETIINRYFTLLHELPEELLKRFVQVDYANDMALAGFVSARGRQHMVAVGRYFRALSTSSAEFAITVHEEWRRCGLGSFLLRALMKAAVEHGLTQLTADVLATNHAMMRLLRKNSNLLKVDLGGGVYHVVLPMDPIQTVRSAKRSKATQAAVAGLGEDCPV